MAKRLYEATSKRSPTEESIRYLPYFNYIVCTDRGFRESIAGMSNDEALRQLGSTYDASVVSVIQRAIERIFRIKNIRKVEIRVESDRPPSPREGKR